MSRIMIILLAVLLAACTVEKLAAPQKESQSGFCGRSTLGTCTTDSDCRVTGCSGQVCQAVKEEPLITTCEWQDCYDSKKFGVQCGCLKGQCQWK